MASWRLANRSSEEPAVPWSAPLPVVFLPGGFTPVEGCAA
jgi:hypothetical protein